MLEVTDCSNVEAFGSDQPVLFRQHHPLHPLNNFSGGYPGECPRENISGIMSTQVNA
jgi:hypothetical protein